jgi:hypothetical protein
MLHLLHSLGFSKPVSATDRVVRVELARAESDSPIHLSSCYSGPV